MKGYWNLCFAFSLRNNEKWAEQQVAAGNSSASFTPTKHLTEPDEPDTLKKWGTYKGV